MEFKETLLRAKEGSRNAQEVLFLQYRPLVISLSMVEGIFLEDLYQELSRVFLHCIECFKLEEMERRQ